MTNSCLDPLVKFSEKSVIFVFFLWQIPLIFELSKNSLKKYNIYVSKMFTPVEMNILPKEPSDETQMNSH